MSRNLTAARLLSRTSVERIGITQTHVAVSELTKLRTVRSTRYALFAGFVMTIAFAIIPALISASRWNTMTVQERIKFNPLLTTLMGVNLAQLAIGVVGVLAVTGEYSTGMIRSTFAAVPKRLPVLWAKLGVLGGVTVVVVSGNPDRLLHGAGNPSRPQAEWPGHSAVVFRPRRCTRDRRRRALSHAHRSVRPRNWRNSAQHGRRNLSACGNPFRCPRH